MASVAALLPCLHELLTEGEAPHTGDMQHIQLLGVHGGRCIVVMRLDSFPVRSTLVRTERTRPPTSQGVGLTERYTFPSTPSTDVVRVEGPDGSQSLVLSRMASVWFRSVRRGPHKL